MQATTLIIFAILLVCIVTTIMARQYEDDSQENPSLEQRRSDIRRLLREFLANKRSARF
jgi:hypothetical protein